MTVLRLPASPSSAWPATDAAPGRGYWLSDPVALQADKTRLRAGQRDRAVDEELIALHDAKDGTVFDVWFVPWLVRRASMRVWLEASLDRRVARVLQDCNERDIGRIAAEVAAKDARAQDYALREYGIDIVSDRSPFGVVVDLNGGLPSDVLTRLLVSMAAIWSGRAPAISGRDKMGD